MTHIDVEEMARAGETVHDPVAIPKVEVNTERFNTVNLQAEIAKGMQQIMDATEKTNVTDTLDNINRMVEDVPYLKMQMEEEKPEAQPEQNTRHIETDEEIDGSLKTNFKELLGEDSDGQMSMMTNEKNMIEHQITGQMTIEEVLSEWGENAQGCGSCTGRCQKAETRIRQSACTAGGRRYYGSPDRSIAKTGCGTGREGGYCGGNDGNTATDAGKGNTAGNE